MIKKKCKELDSLLNSSDSSNINEDLGDDVDFHRVVIHYVYIRVKESQRKLDNYVALYGFLRTMTLIACVITVFLFVMGFSCFSQVGANVDYVGYTWVFIVMPLVCNILFLGFMKFYRRFTLENYMVLMVSRINNNNGRNHDNAKSNCNCSDI